MNGFSRFISCAILAVISLVANAGDWPRQPVKIVLPYPPGGASDVTARLLGAKLTQDASLGATGNYREPPWS